MKMLRDAFIAVVITSMISLLLTGCASLSGGHTQSASGRLGSRQLSATVTGVRDFSLRTDPPKNSGVVTFDAHRLVFEGDSVLLDGEEVTKLASESGKIDIHYKKGVLTIDDGVRRVRITRL